MNWKIILIVAIVIMVAIFAFSFFDQEKAAPGEPGFVAPGAASGSGEVTVTVVDKAEGGGVAEQVSGAAEE